MCEIKKTAYTYNFRRLHYSCVTLSINFYTINIRCDRDNKFTYVYMFRSYNFFDSVHKITLNQKCKI